MSVQASGKAGDHEWEPIEKGRGYCSCGFGRLISFFLSREEWQAHLTFMQAEQEAKPVASSAHFPRITKHDLEVVVEAMDKLREALAAARPREVPAAQRLACSHGNELRDCEKCTKEMAPGYFPKEVTSVGMPTVEINAGVEADNAEAEESADSTASPTHYEGGVDLIEPTPPSVDGLEAQLVEVLQRHRFYRSYTDQQLIDLAAFIRTRDRELVGLAEKWEKENSLRSDDSYRYPQQLRAVLAARSPVHGNLAPEVPAEQPRCSHGELVEKLEGQESDAKRAVQSWKAGGDCSGAERDRWLNYYTGKLEGTREALRAVLAARNEGGTK